MRISISLLFLVVIAPMLSSPAQASPNEETLRNDLFQGISVWNDAFQSHTVSRLSTILSDDFQFASAGGKCCSAERCINAFSALLEKRPTLTWTISSTDLNINANWLVAHDSGTWMESWMQPDGTVTIFGKYAALWKHQNDAWQLQSILFTPLSCEGESAYCKAN